VKARITVVGKTEIDNYLFFCTNGTILGVPVSNLIKFLACNAPAWSVTNGFINPPLVSCEMRQHIKDTISVAIKLFMKQKRNRYNGWPLVGPDGGWHEWLIWVCEREGTPKG